MNCPECGRRAQVTHTVTRADGSVLRRRKCNAGHMFRTLETLEKITCKTTLTPSKQPPQGSQTAT